MTYTVNRDRTFRQELGTCHGVVEAGQVPGVAFTVTGIKSFGIVERGGQSLLFTEAEPNVETTTSIFGTTFAICARTGTAIRK